MNKKSSFLSKQTLKVMKMDSSDSKSRIKKINTDIQEKKKQERMNFIKGKKSCMIYPDD